MTISLSAASPVALHLEQVQLLLVRARGRVDIHTVEECDSSNTRLLAMAKAGAPTGTVLCAERQTAGRGRRGRTWHQAEQGLAFSLLWRFPVSLNVHGLSLLVGLAVAECMGDTVQLKWPNDVLLQGKKLAGVLIESNAPGTYVMGVGINLGQLNDVPAAIAAVAATLTQRSREEVLGLLLEQLVPMLDEFSNTCFTQFQSRWLARHAYQDLEICVSAGEGAVRVGRCVGVDAQGALLLAGEHGVESIISGEVSVRLV